MENNKTLARRRSRPVDRLFMGGVYLAAGVCVLLLISIVGYVLLKGLPYISWEFLSTKPSALRGTYGILPNIINTLWIVVLTLLIATPIGVGGAIYLCEYARPGKLITVIEFTTETLSGIPSVLYGLFGFLFFGIFLKLGYSILSGAFTLAIMVLPIIVTTTRESLKAVPRDYREGAMAMGAGRWYAIRTIILPSALPGILTAVILAVGRMVGESAALIFTAGIATTLPVFSSLRDFFSHQMESGATLTVQLYQYMLRGDNERAYAIAAVLLLLVLGINLLTRLVAGRLQNNRAK